MIRVIVLNVIKVLNPMANILFDGTYYYNKWLFKRF